MANSPPDRLGVDLADSQRIWDMPAIVGSAGTTAVSNSLTVDKRKTRKKYSAEENIQIILEGLLGGGHRVLSVASLACITVY